MMSQVTAGNYTTENQIEFFPSKMSYWFCFVFNGLMIYLDTLEMIYLDTFIMFFQSFL